MSLKRETEPRSKTNLQIHQELYKTQVEAFERNLTVIEIRCEILNIAKGQRIFQNQKHYVSQSGQKLLKFLAGYKKSLKAKSVQNCIFISVFFTIVMN